MHGHSSVNISMTEVCEMQTACIFASCLFHLQALKFMRLGMKDVACEEEKKSKMYEAMSRKSFNRDYMACNSRYTKQRLVRMTSLIRRLIHADDVMAKSEGPDLYKARDEFDYVREELRKYINIHPRGGKLNK